MKYVALVHGKVGAYSVSFPDILGCVGAGNDIDAALLDAGKALSFHVQGMVADGEKVPTARSLEVIKSDHSIHEMLEDASFAYVSLIEDLGSPKRVNFSIDRGLLSAIDDEASLRGVTRSAFLASAARKELQN